MDETINIFSVPIEIITGEMHTLVEESGEKSKYYLSLAKIGDNTILFHYTDASGAVKDYAKSIVDNTPLRAMPYLENVITENTNLLIYWSQFPDTSSDFTIYYDCTCEDKTIDNLINWMQENNDFDCIEYKFTEVRDGHQVIAGQ